MKFMKKVAAAFVAAVMAVSAFAAITVTAGADSIYDTAKEIKSGSAVTATGITTGQCADYKVNVTKSGTLTLDFTAGMNYAYIYVYDSDGNTVPYSDYDIKSGSKSDDSLRLKWNAATEKVKAKVSYLVEKGTYYIRIKNDYYSGGNYKLNLTATFPSATVSKAKISYLTLKVYEGDTIELGTVMTGSGSVSWSSSKTSVATVNSSGKVVAKKSGSTIITAKCGTSKQRIKIIVR